MLPHMPSLLDPATQPLNELMLAEAQALQVPDDDFDSPDLFLPLVGSHGDNRVVVPHSVEPSDPLHLDLLTPAHPLQGFPGDSRVVVPHSAEPSLPMYFDLSPRDPRPQDAHGANRVAVPHSVESSVPTLSLIHI